MIVAAYADNLYNIVLVLHLGAVIVAFAPAVVHPLLTSQYKSDAEPLRRFGRHASTNTRRLHFPALVVVGLLGMLLVVLSDDVFDFQQTWVSLAFVVWLALCGVVLGMILPAERKLARGATDAQRALDRSGGLATILLLGMLYLMVFKPGWP